MEKFKVSFEANNQQLKSIGTKHASDTYADIEATFVLGEKWTDMDSVSAVWWNDFTKVATVLDSQGKCIVPHEVLTRKGCVRVNLVGSIVEGNELVTRLTSYSAEAVQVNEKIKLTGTETSEITPSQYEQFVANVKADADRAEAGADEAEASAQSASESATASAQSASDSQGYAQDAYNSSVTAENAKDDAEGARDEILGMRATAETLEAGSDATASYSDGLLTLGIPRGDKGEQGIQGETGATPNFSIGEVDTLEPNESATATITGTAENPVLNLGIPKGEQGDVNLSQLEALLPTETASGEIVTITDGQSVVPAKSLKVSLEPIQDLNGYDKPWAGGAGKNKFEVTATDTTTNGITFKIVDGVITLSGTATSAFNFTLGTITLNAGNYKINGTPSGGERGTAVIQVVDGADNPSILGDFAYTLSEQKTITVRLHIANGFTPTSTSNTFKPMIRLASEADDTYAPYSNICPISGHTSVNVIVSPTTDAEDGNTYHTDLGRTVYGGTLDVVSGELVVDRAMVTFDGSSDETWLKDTDGTSLDGIVCFRAYLQNTNIKKPEGTAVTINYIGRMFSNTMPTLKNGYINQYPMADTVMGVTGYSGISSNYFYINVNKTLSSIQSVTELRAWLAENPTTVVYELATPQTIQLTPQEVQLLLGTNNIWSDGNVTLVYSADIQRYIEKKLGTRTTLTMSRPMTVELNETETEVAETE